MFGWGVLLALNQILAILVFDVSFSNLTKLGLPVTILALVTHLVKLLQDLILEGQHILLLEPEILLASHTTAFLAVLGPN